MLEMRPVIQRNSAGQIIWNPELDAFIVQKEKEGISRRAIGRLLGVERNTVIGRLYRLGMTAPAKRPGEWTAEMDATLRSLKDQGHSDRSIAERLGVTFNAVVSYRNRHCIPAIYRPGFVRLPVFTPRRVYEQKKRENFPKLSEAAKRGAATKARMRNAVVEAERAAGKGIEELRADAFQALPRSAPVAFMDLKADDCRWPIDGEGAMFCGCKKQEGDEAYCLTHRLLSNGKGSKSERQAVKAARRVSRFEYTFSRHA